MKTFSDEQSKIETLLEEAAERRGALTDDTPNLGDGTPWTEGKGKVLDRGSDEGSSSTMKNFLGKSSSGADKNGSNKSGSADATTLANFLASSGSDSNSSGGSGSSNGGASNATMSDFLKGGSGSGSKNGTDDASRNGGLKLASGETLNNFLKKGNKRSKRNAPYINFDELLKGLNDLNKKGALDIDQVLAYFESLGDGFNTEDKEFQDTLAKFLESTVKKGEKINGLLAFLSQSMVLKKPVNPYIDVSSEIIRTNYTIEYENEINQVELADTQVYLDLMLRNLPRAKRLERVSSYLLKMPGVKKVDRTKKDYHVPNWFKLSERKNMEMRVKQLNQLPHAMSQLGEQQVRTNEYTESLSKILQMKSTNTEDEKEGFFQGGATMDELSQMRKRLSNIEPETSFYETIKDRRLISFSKDGFVSYDASMTGKPLILPRVILGELKIPKTEFKNTSNNDFKADSIRQEFYHRVYNTSVQALLNRAPDFRQNMFLGLFVYVNDEEGNISDLLSITNKLMKKTDIPEQVKLEKSEIDMELTRLSNAYEKVIKSYFVRIRDLKVPGATLETYTVPVLNREVKKISSSYKENHNISITLDIDELGLIIRQFNLLTGQFGNIVGQDEHNVYVDNFYPATFMKENKGRLDLVITYNDFRISPRNQDPDGLIRRSSYMPAMQNLRTGMDYITDRQGDRVYGDPNAYRKFVLEDVKILGFDGGLNFQRDSDGKLSLPLNLIFRRITTVDNNLTKSN